MVLMMDIDSVLMLVMKGVVLVLGPPTPTPTNVCCILLGMSKSVLIVVFIRIKRLAEYQI